MMTIGDLLEVLENYEHSLPVRFDFCGCYPSGIGSWRGDYAQPSLGWESGGSGLRPDVARLIAWLKEATDGRKFPGWKGGDYRYTNYSRLWVDNSGEYTRTIITGLSEDYGTVYLHTKRSSEDF